MKKVIGIFILLILLGVFSCKKAIKKDPNYIGYWRCGATCFPAITIKSDGSGIFTYTDTQTDCQGGGRNGTARITGNTLRIGIKRFKIDLEPTIIDTINLTIGIALVTPQRSNMKIVLDGDTYYRVIE